MSEYNVSTYENGASIFVHGPQGETVQYQKNASGRYSPVTVSINPPGKDKSWVSQNSTVGTPDSPTINVALKTYGGAPDGRAASRPMTIEEGKTYQGQLDAARVAANQALADTGYKVRA